VARWAILVNLSNSFVVLERWYRGLVVCLQVLLVLSCGPVASRHSLVDGVPMPGNGAESYPIGYPAFGVAVERVVGDCSPHFGYSLAVASYRMMVAHHIPLTDQSITRAVNYVVHARKIAGPRQLFGNGTRVINILHEYDSFDNLFASNAVIRKEMGLGAQAQDIWTFQGPSEIAPALKTISNSKGPITLYIYAHGLGQTIRLSDSVSLELSELAKALKRRGPAWTNVLADECDGVVTYLPAALRQLGVEIPSYIVSATPRGGMTRGSRLLNALSGTGTGAGSYFIDPSKLEFEDLARSQDFVFVWTPTVAQRRQLERVWPFPNRPIDVQNADLYPSWVWELAAHSGGIVAAESPG
jgi:hypothetical protein